MSRDILSEFAPLRAAIHGIGGHTSFVSSVSVSPDGTRITTGSEDHTIRIWNLETGTLLATMYNVDEGFLWTTPPDESAANGWLWTDREDLVTILEVDKDGSNPTVVDDDRRERYLQIYNNRRMVMARVRGLEYQKAIAQRYFLALGRHKAERQATLMLDPGTQD